ncbi:uncharacterized protein LOC110102300 [Dendrobium catenatum]|uniref:Transmembrane protein n=1 Tax=Dendrobium catenatum TaxID=906689 RepID=A0A2I0WVZ2_9ASPA|nr:uncharacterized protein LOC110102300 [Dendrobium catenatum]PKU79822.1 hypothetical protein MA16_Dca024395 [Dendrobium catenatum]
MAEEAHAPSAAPGLAGQEEIERLPTQNSLQSTSEDASQQQPPLVHPSTVPLVMPPQNPDQSDYGPGLYAIPTYSQFMGMMPGFPPSTLIPLTFKIPTRTNSSGTGGEELGHEARQQQGPQRPVVVRRFHFAFQLDLALIIKLAAVVFLFSQEGSRQRLILLVLFASFIYLYQTGALTPLIRWIRRGAAPQLRPAAHPEQPPMRHFDGIQPAPEGNVEADNQNDHPPAVVNENQPEARQRNQNQFWYILKEIQMFFIGFITSLLPGFHHHNE